VTHRDHRLLPPQPSSQALRSRCTAKASIACRWERKPMRCRRARFCRTVDPRSQRLPDALKKPADLKVANCATHRAYRSFDLYPELCKSDEGDLGPADGVSRFWTILCGFRQSG